MSACVVSLPKLAVLFIVLPGAALRRGSYSHWLDWHSAWLAPKDRPRMESVRQLRTGSKNRAIGLQKEIRPAASILGAWLALDATNGLRDSRSPRRCIMPVCVPRSRIF
jgi:hypothetical protein